MSLDHFNHNYDGGVPDIPYGIGDRYYAQDMARDFWFLYSKQYLESEFINYPVLLKDSYVQKGTDFQKIDIPIAIGLVNYDVEVPNSFAAIPPTKKIETIIAHVQSIAQSDYDISGTATLDGVSTNFVKIAYAEINGSSRNRAKKAGSYNYEKIKSFVISVDTAGPTNYEIAVATIVGDGATFMTINHFLKTKKISDSYDYVVNTQEEFNMVVQRTAANNYKIADTINSILINYISGGYKMWGGTSFLQAGDTWGDLQTNFAQKIVFQPYAYLDYADNLGKILINTDYCHVYGMHMYGNSIQTNQILTCIEFAASHITLEKCVVLSRYSTASIAVVIRGSATAIHNETSQVIDCKIEDINGSNNVYCIYNIENVKNCYINNINSGNNLIGILNGGYIRDTIIKNMDAPTNTCTGISGAEDVSGCRISILSGATVRGITSTDVVSHCIVKACIATGTCVGIGNNIAPPPPAMKIVNSCLVYNLTGTAAYGFGYCDCVVSSYTYGLNGLSNSWGYYFCNYVAGILIGTLTGIGQEGMKNCEYVAAAYPTPAANTNNDWVDTVDVTITNKVSTPSKWT